MNIINATSFSSLEKIENRVLDLLNSSKITLSELRRNESKDSSSMKNLIERIRFFHQHIFSINQSMYAKTTESEQVKIHHLSTSVERVLSIEINLDQDNSESVSDKISNLIETLDFFNELIVSHSNEIVFEFIKNSRNIYSMKDFFEGLRKYISRFSE